MKLYNSVKKNYNLLREQDFKTALHVNKEISVFTVYYLSKYKDYCFL